MQEITGLAKRKGRRSDPKYRMKLFLAQGAICYYCEKQVTFKKWTIDHLIPLSRGGANTKYNKVGCCYKCNHLKGPLTSNEFIFNSDDKIRKELTKFIFKQLN